MSHHPERINGILLNLGSMEDQELEQLVGYLDRQIEHSELDKAKVLGEIALRAPEPSQLEIDYDRAPLPEVPQT